MLLSTGIVYLDSQSLAVQGLPQSLKTNNTKHYLTKENSVNIQKDGGKTTGIVLIKLIKNIHPAGITSLVCVSWKWYTSYV